jgi:hypothetical protein
MNNAALKNVNSTLLKWIFLYILIQFHWVTALFSYSMYLLTSYLLILSIIDKDMFQLQTPVFVHLFSFTSFSIQF